jgi:hypothetical protein
MRRLIVLAALAAAATLAVPAEAAQDLCVRTSYGTDRTGMHQMRVCVPH